MTVPEAHPTPANPAFKLVRVLDLFAGAGGLSAGFKQSSMRYETVRAVEMDLAAASTYAANHGAEKVFAGSIQDWLRDEVVPLVDVVIGGPPCQGFSTLGKQDVEDVRNFLWHEYAETVRRAQPKYFVVENVAAFAKSSQFADFQRETSEGGLLYNYSFDYRVLNSADFGAPQARKRTVIIGWRDGQSNPGFPEPTHGPGRVHPHVAVSTAFLQRGIVEKVTQIDLPPRRTSILGGRAIPGPYLPRELHVTRNYTKLSLDRFACIREGGNRFQIDENLLPPCWKKHRTGTADVMGRLHKGKPSVTIRTEFFKPEKGRYLHPTENRAITHYEAAALQGFPEDFQFMGSKTEIARQIGNAVPIPLGAAIGRHLLGLL
ncbi:DNA cytosine methyltransferase [Herbiconiux daphne]|uniref:Cytosine-specific methyltransferase n=1 Tax=Herbiconiux daphne TaxID=2970914 RepID=A0ABT2H1I2_9MICO|nr:DNA cytosine methyltransferase [Herbiconiux daphne]MCS5733780.1 DNA cytosine methyltransferase [Herbiconiux daphne]